MPRNTFFLITALMILCVTLFAVALHGLYFPAKHKTPIMPVVSLEPSATPVVFPVGITFSPPSISLTPSQQGQLGVILEANGNQVTGVQLEVEYDKTLLTDLMVTPEHTGDSPFT